MTQLTCQWPVCGERKSQSTIFRGRSALESHYRSAHYVHEFSLSPLLDDWPQSPKSALKKPHPGDLPALISEADNQDSAQEHRFTLLRAQIPAPISVDPGYSNRNGGPPQVSDKSTSRLSPTQPTNGDRLPRMARTNKSPGEPYNGVHDGARFSLLPKDRRPEPTAPVHEPTFEPDIYSFVNPEPLISPGTVPNTAAEPSHSGEYQLPKSSLAPSYILASANRFTRSEVSAFTPNTRVARLNNQPLFVYGSLMFPSILRQQAETFVSPMGIYSESNQRRLRSDAGDWTYVNMSLRHAAEQMTPAMLTGYDRWSPDGLSCAAIVNASKTPAVMANIESSGQTWSIERPKGEVQGFLVFGLAQEALKCCDILLSQSSLEDLYEENGLPPPEGSRLPKNSLPFVRKTVNVTLSLKGGELRSLDATTYVWNAPIATLQSGWDINRFVKSRSFRKLSGAQSSSLWMTEEKVLAKIMGITFVLPGDALSDAVLRKSTEDIASLLKQGDDVNAPCQGYGHVLQAASTTGSEEIVSLLLKRGASVNAAGGQYENALLAATVQGYEGVARILIKAGADILKDGGIYISPIYQAVSHSDVDMVLLLLERGGWLSRNYGELVDLASEKGNEEIMDLLREYDIRDLQRKLPASNRRASSSDSDQDSEGSLNNNDNNNKTNNSRSKRIRRATRRNEVAMKPAKVIRAVVCRALILKGTKGKWTGIKGVGILRTAIEAGVSPKILDDIRPHLGSIQKILDFLKNAVLNYADEEKSSARHKRRGITAKFTAGTVTELSDSSDSYQDQVKDPDPEPRTRRKVSFASKPSVTVLRSEPQLQKDDPVESHPSEAGSAAIGAIDRSSRKAVCSSCDGRGGRRGTGYTCSKCNNTGRYQDSRCSSCNGAGQTYSERNRCRDCDGARFVYTRSQTFSAPEDLPQSQARYSRPYLPINSHHRPREASPVPSRRRSEYIASASPLNSSSSAWNTTSQNFRSNQSLHSDDPPPPYSSQAQLPRIWS
jgi:hypothetical protein